MKKVSLLLALAIAVGIVVFAASPVLAADGSGLSLPQRCHVDPIIVRGTPGNDTQVTLGTPNRDVIVQFGLGGNDVQFSEGGLGNGRLYLSGGAGNDETE
jgi:hypothetical protein